MIKGSFKTQKTDPIPMRSGRFLYETGLFLPTDVNGKVIPIKLLSEDDKSIGIIDMAEEQQSAKRLSDKTKQEPRNLTAMIHFREGPWKVEIFGEGEHTRILALIAKTATFFGVGFIVEYRNEIRKEMI